MINKIICIIAGHSGGHIIPCITLANREKSEIVIITTQSKFDKEIIEKNCNYKDITELPINKIPSGFFKKIKFLFNFIISTFKCFSFLKKNKPTKIISTGGLISIPACLVAQFLKIPVEIYELNVEPGKTTLLLSRFFKKINICFQETSRYFPNNTCHKFKYPVKFETSKLISREEALKKINFESNKKTIFITGGSQGSLELNKLAKDIVRLKNNIQVIHQIGINDKENWEEFYTVNKIVHKTFSFTDDMETLYQAADIIICRAGAGTLAEISYLKKRALVIPLQTNTTSHQLLNARQWADEFPELITVCSSTTEVINFI